MSAFLAHNCDITMRSMSPNICDLTSMPVMFVHCDIYMISRHHWVEECLLVQYADDTQFLNCNNVKETFYFHQKTEETSGVSKLTINIMD